MLDWFRTWMQKEENGIQDEEPEVESIVSCEMCDTYFTPREMATRSVFPGVKVMKRRCRRCDKLGCLRLDKRRRVEWEKLNSKPPSASGIRYFRFTT
nr:hypothetical protein [Sicyoidochytrium minutum DNA virus]